MVMTSIWKIRWIKTISRTIVSIHVVKNSVNTLAELIVEKGFIFTPGQNGEPATFGNGTQITLQVKTIERVRIKNCYEG